ncbi:hypothetical protein BD309DRAFT_817724, partial [Dichomitus squalens]
ALSKAKQRRINSDFKEHWVRIAVEQYKDEQGSGKLKPKSVRTICDEVMVECFEKTKKPVKICHQTVINHANGKRSAHDFNAGKKWLLPEEEEQVIAFAIDTAKRGFPLNHRRLKEHVDEI